MITYLASPYTSDHQPTCHERYHLACKAAAHLMQQGHVVFSPIAHSHGIARFIKDHSHDLWMLQDLPFLDFAAKMVVLTLPGWEESKDIKQEIEYARDKGIPVEHKSMENITCTSD
jgi:hypothetical protein